jgi:hypothetical protein
MATAINAVGEVYVVFEQLFDKLYALLKKGTIVSWL